MEATSGDGYVGSVGALWRYPVKSMAGQELEASEVGVRGLRGDRAFALVDDADGRVATAKNPRRWPRMFEFSAAYTADAAHGADAQLPPLVITLPDGSTLSGDRPDASAVLSRVLERDVRLCAATAARGPVTAQEYWPDLEGLEHRDAITDFELPTGTFFDSAVVHLVTTATLARLGELSDQGPPATRRFRPNVVVDSPDLADGFAEDAWIGRTLHLGDSVRLEVTEGCARCVMVTLAQPGLAKDLGVLRTAAQHHAAEVGVYASVRQGGNVRRGDRVTVHDAIPAGQHDGQTATVEP